MSVRYQAVTWNRQKRIYDTAIGFGCVGFLAVFTALSLQRPDATIETALIRGLGGLAFTLLHVILCIGPLARLDRRFLPLLYNRRHLGVTMALVALAHATFAVLQYHGAAEVNPLVSVLAGPPSTRFPTAFPFEWLGMAALIVILLMAATSHDFWLSVLTPPIWKTLHMGVYLAYGLLVLHVVLGIHQAEPATGSEILLFGGMALVFGLHFTAGIREWRRDRPLAPGPDGWVEVCRVEEIGDGRARSAVIGAERVAVFRYDGKVSCVSAVCRHQNGPLAEGRIVDGCITCPWHGYQYLPDSGASPPPFNDLISTFTVRVASGRVYVDPRGHPPGTPVQPAPIE